MRAPDSRPKSPAPAHASRRAPRAWVLALVALVAGASAGLAACEAERAVLPEDADAGPSRALRDAEPAETGADARVPPGPLDASLPDAPSARDAGEDARDAGAVADAATAGVVLNEIFAADALSRRYVELAGPPGAPIGDLSLRIIGSSGVVLKQVAVASTVTAQMPARGTWVVGGLGEVAVDQGYTVSAWDLPSDSGSVQLVRTGASGLVLVDVVGYGVPAVRATSAPTTTSEGAPAASPGAGALLRKPPARDTDNNAGDFCAGPASPNRANVCAP